MGALILSDIGATVVSHDERLHREQIVRWCGPLKESCPLEHRFHILLDGAGYHRSDWVREAAFVLKIALHSLPSYNPHLTPIDRL